MHVFIVESINSLTKFSSMDSVAENYSSARMGAVMLPAVCVHVGRTILKSWSEFACDVGQHTCDMYTDVII